MAARQLTEAEEIELLALLEAQYGGEGLDDFMRRVSPRFDLPAHTVPVRALFEASRHREVRATISMPPRHAKSYTLAHGLAWRVVRDPACTHAVICYSESLARKFSRHVRRLVREAGVGLSQESSSVTDWATRQGGGLIARGVAGSLTGFGVTGVMVVDDPIKNREEAESAQLREKVWESFTNDAYTRLEPGSSLIINQTRWHEDDPIGRVKSGELDADWEHITMPAVHDGAGRAVDEREEEGAAALWPEVYPLEKLAKTRKTLAEYGWWSLYQQAPRPRGRGLFGEPSRFDLDSFSWEGCRGVISVDPAASAKTHADHSAIVVAAMRGWAEASEMFILEVFRLQVEIPELCRRLRALQRKYRLLIAVESVGAFKAVPQMLRDADPSLRIVEVQPQGDKFTRAQPLSAAWADSRVHVPVAAPWDVDDYLTEMQAFTGVGDASDDQVDATTQAWTGLYRAKRGRERGTRRAPHLPFG